MIGGQQAMFGNFASYSQQISPGGGQGYQPTYHNPMGGGGGGYAASPYNTDANIGQSLGPAGVSAAANIAPPMLGAAAMMGSFAPGRLGSAFGMLDPTMAGMTGFGAASGINFGRHGAFSGAGWRNLASGIGRVASGGLGGIARAGLAGLGGAAIAAAPALVAGQALSYAGGQMVQGAQFQNQVHGFMQNQFRHLNPQSATGFGFSREQTSGVADMLRTMGHQDTMTGPQELLRVMKQGVGSGHFRAVQDVKEFKSRFKEMVKTLKTISEDMSTTLEGAMPFFQRSKQMGFWTPQDIVRSSQMTRQAAQATGMSVAQTQGMMAQGAAMARQVGAQGALGAQGMARTMGLVGGGLRSGVISEREMAEATGGLTGAAATQSMAGSLQAATTRFARGRTGRWLLAALGNRGFQGFDQNRLQQLMSGNMSIGDISRLARRNIGRQGAFNFVQNEQDLRGQLLRQGPGAQLGLIRGLIGNRLYGEGAKDRYITRRLMKRYFGVGGRQADMMAKLARVAPEIMQQNRARSAAVLDQQERERDRMMAGSVEGLKRKAAQWWDRNVKDPLQKFGADMSKSISDWWERTTDKFWGRAGRGFMPRGIGADAAKAMQSFALGDTQQMQDVFGKRGQLGRLLGDQGRQPMTMAGLTLGTNRGVLASLVGTKPIFGDITKREAALAGLGLNIRGKTQEQRRETESMARRQLSAAQRGIAAVGDDTAKALGFDTGKNARAALQAAQKEMSSSSYLQAAMAIQREDPKASDSMRALQMVKRIRAGKVGGPALRALVAKSVDPQKAMMRLAAAQSAQARQSTIGLRFEDQAEALGAREGGTAAQQAQRLQDVMEDQAGKLAEATGATMEGAGGTVAAAVTRWATGRQIVTKESRQQAIMGLFKGPQARKFRQALTLMNKQGTPEQKAKARAEARNLLSQMATDKDLSDDQREVLRKMGDPDDPASKQIEKIAGVMGAATQGGRRVAAREVIERRMRRLDASMGDDRDRIMERLNKMTVSGGEGAQRRGLGDVVKQMMEAGGEAQDPEQFQNRLAAIARAATEAEGEDQEKAIADAARTMAALPGGEAMVAALQTGQRARGAVKKLTGRGRFRQAAAASALSRGLGLGDITKEDMRKIQKGGEAADKVLEDLTKGRTTAQKEMAKKLFEGIKAGDMKKLLEVGVAGAANRAQAGLHDKDKTLKAQLQKMKPGDVLGDLGSAKGRHLEATKTNEWLSKILDAINKGGVTGNETDDPKKK
jgi:hypothetical protein